jgi:hypothetical protein
MGLPYDIIETQNSNLGKFLECLAIEDVAIFYSQLFQYYGHLVYFLANLVYFKRFGMLYEEKSGYPATNNDSFSSLAFNTLIFL